MMPAHFPLRRRQLVFGALTLLLHLLVFDWFAGQLGRRREDALPKPPALSPLELIRIALPVPPAPPSAPPSAAEPALALEPPPLPTVAPEPVEVSGAAPAAPPDVDADASADADAATAHDHAAGRHAVAGQQGAAPHTAEVQSQRTSGATDLPSTAPSTSLPAPRRYTVALPPQADIAFDVARTDADGRQWHGDAMLSWRRTATGYAVRADSGIRVLGTHVDLLALTSEGTLGDEGFVPILMTERRRGRAMTATHFHRKEGAITFSASQASVALVPGAQDRGSLPLQLAAIGRGDAQQISGNIAILVGEGRGASVFSFTVAGQAQVDTGMGLVATWHLVRLPGPGSYQARLDVWLAPAHGWLPVRIRSLDANGAVTTQTARTIVMKETGSP